MSDWLIDRDGWLSGIVQIPSPNFDERPTDEISLIVIHSISLPPKVYSGTGVTSLFTNALDPLMHHYYPGIVSLRVSSHFFIRRDGSTVQYVPVQLRAWHAGVSQWRGRQRCNDFSVGIELEGADDDVFTEVQYARLNDLVGVLTERYPVEDVVGHSDIAPGRKTDPGIFFDWMRLSFCAPGRDDC